MPGSLDSDGAGYRAVWVLQDMRDGTTSTHYQGVYSKQGTAKGYLTTNIKGRYGYVTKDQWKPPADSNARYFRAWMVLVDCWVEKSEGWKRV